MSRSVALALVLLVTSALWAAPATTFAAPAQQAAPSFRGSSTGVYGPFPLSAGPVVLRGRSNGDGNFAVSLGRPDAGQAPDDPAAWGVLIFDSVGKYDGAVAEVAPQAGNYYLLVTLVSGSHQITVEQPTVSSTPPTEQRSFSGMNQQVPPAFTLRAGAATITGQKDAVDRLAVTLYRLNESGGASITDENYGRVIDSSLTNLSVPLQIPADGVYLLYVDAEGTGSLNWTVTIQQPDPTPTQQPTR
jgi:hypothetical protein